MYSSGDECDFNCIHCGYGDYFEVGFILKCRNCGKYPFDDTIPNYTDEEYEEMEERTEALLETMFFEDTSIQKMLHLLVKSGDIVKRHDPDTGDDRYFWSNGDRV